VNTNDNWILWTASHYHFRDLAKFQDGSLGSFSITHEQFKRELAEAYRRGAEADISVPKNTLPRAPWRAQQEKISSRRDV
jgi:hypothetical protein